MKKYIRGGLLIASAIIICFINTSYNTAYSKLKIEDIDYSSPHIVLTKSKDGFDNGFIESPNVWWDTNRKQYGMVYTGYYDDGENERAYGSIGIAWSDDLENWIKSETPVFERNPEPGQCDSGSITGPVMYMEDGKYYLYYIACDSDGYEAGRKTICMASSDDLENWERCSINPLIEPGGDNWYGHAPFHVNIQKHDGIYYMFFNAKPTGSWVENIGFATSTDLVNWTTSKEPVLFHGEEGSYDEKIVGDPYIFDIGDEYMYMMYFCANYASETLDCLARTKKTDFPYNWEKLEDINPLTEIGYAKPSIIIKEGQIYHFFGSSDAGIGYYTSNTAKK